VMIRLWVHEVFRVFYDRLTDDSDRAWLFSLMRKLVKEEFKENFDTVFGHLTEDSKVTEIDLRSLMFGVYFISSRAQELFNSVVVTVVDGAGSTLVTTSVMDVSY